MDDSDKRTILTSEEIEKLAVDYSANAISDQTAESWLKAVGDKDALDPTVAFLKIQVYSLLPIDSIDPANVDVDHPSSNPAIANASVYVFYFRTVNEGGGLVQKKSFDVVKTNENGNAYFRIPLTKPSESIFIVIKHPKYYAYSGEEQVHSINPKNISIGLKPKSVPVTNQQIGFYQVEYQCYDGTGDRIRNDTCMSPSDWKRKIISACENHCKKTEDGTAKCGVNSFNSSNECTLDTPSNESTPVPEFEWNDTVSKELVYKLINRMANLERQVAQLQDRISRLERLLNVDYYPSIAPTVSADGEKKYQSSIPSVAVTNVQPNLLETTAGAIEPAADNSTIEIRDGVPFVVNQDRSVKEEIPIELVRNYAEKKISEECGLNCVADAKGYKIKAAVDDGGKETYVVSAEIPNTTPILNWFVPMQTKTYSVPQEEIDRIKENRLKQSSFVRELQNDPTLSSYAKETK